MAEVELVYRDVSEDCKLGHLEERDARTLAQDLRAGPSIAGERISAELLAAVYRDDSGKSVEVFLKDDHELAAVHETCLESLALKDLPPVKRLCAEIARARDRL